MIKIVKVMHAHVRAKELHAAGQGSVSHFLNQLYMNTNFAATHSAVGCHMALMPNEASHFWKLAHNAINNAAHSQIDGAVGVAAHDLFVESDIYHVLARPYPSVSHFFLEEFEKNRLSHDLTSDDHMVSIALEGLIGRWAMGHDIAVPEFEMKHAADANKHALADVKNQHFMSQLYQQMKHSRRLSTHFAEAEAQTQAEAQTPATPAATDDSSAEKEDTVDDDDKDSKGVLSKFFSAVFSLLGSSSSSSDSDDAKTQHDLNSQLSHMIVDVINRPMPMHEKERAVNHLINSIVFSRSGATHKFSFSSVVN